MGLDQLTGTNVSRTLSVLALSRPSNFTPFMGMF